jgi:hypothetical protein
MNNKRNLQSGLNKYVKLNGKLKTWLLEEISSWEEKVNASFESSYEDGLLDGRKELAENLLEQIKKWEEK